MLADRHYEYNAEMVYRDCELSRIAIIPAPYETTEISHKMLSNEGVYVNYIIGTDGIASTLCETRAPKDGSGYDRKAITIAVWQYMDNELFSDLILDIMIRHGVNRLSINKKRKTGQWYVRIDDMVYDYVIRTMDATNYRREGGDDQTIAPYRVDPESEDVWRTYEIPSNIRIRDIKRVLMRNNISFIVRGNILYAKNGGEVLSEVLQFRTDSEEEGEVQYSSRRKI